MRAPSRARWPDPSLRPAGQGAPPGTAAWRRGRCAASPGSGPARTRRRARRQKRAPRPARRTRDAGTIRAAAVTPSAPPSRVRTFTCPRARVCGHAEGPLGHTMETGGEFNMRMEGGAEPLAGSVDSGRRSGGFWIVWLDDRPSLRALSEAPRILSQALQLRVPHRPWDRVEVSIGPGTRTEGEALSLGSGCIRLTVGEQTSAADAAGIARHEALHLLLASTLGGGEKWCDPDLAFTDWIVRGIEGRLAPAIPRFRTPLPGLLDPVPASRLEVQRRLASAVEDVEAAQRYFGEALLEGLQSAAQGAGTVEQGQLWLVEAALGTYYLEAAGRLWAEDADALRPILLDDWLIDYEQYAHGVSNPPAGAGHLWRIPDPGWSRDAVVRLSVAAQALQRDDHCLFSQGCPPHEAVVWKNRGRVRLPLARSEPGPRLAPLHGFRAVLRAMDGAGASRATGLVEEAARGAEAFEARALWPRIFARLLAARLPLPDLDLPAVPAVQVIDSSAFAAWT